MLLNPYNLKRQLGAVLRVCKHNYISGFRIKSIQNELLIKNFSPESKKMIVFLTPGYDIVNGGILSITSIYEETIKLRDIHGAETIMCTIPGEPPLLKYTKFNNNNYIYTFSQVLQYFQNLQDLMIHIPEYTLANFYKYISRIRYTELGKIKNIHFNIMLQNITMLPDCVYVYKLTKLGKVTITTAHEKYSNSEVRRKFGVPVHKLSTFVSPEKYTYKYYNGKEDLIIISPDPHPRKNEIVRSIQERLPHLRMIVINKLSYEDYKEIISKAKWALTFGEGLDGYFVETIFSGGISFAAYNTEFFTDDFKCLRTVYDSYEILEEKICSDIRELDEKDSFSDYQKKQYTLCAKYYSYEEYKKNLDLFYRGKYTYD